MADYVPLSDLDDFWLCEGQLERVYRSKAVLWIKGKPHFGGDFRYDTENEVLRRVLSPDQYEQCIKLIIKAMAFPWVSWIYIVLSLLILGILCVMCEGFYDLDHWSSTGQLIFFGIMVVLGSIAWCLYQSDIDSKFHVIKCLKDINQQLLNPSNNQSINSNTMIISSLSPCYFLMGCTVTTIDGTKSKNYDLILMDPNASINRSVNQPISESINLSISDESSIDYNTSLMSSEQQPEQQSDCQQSINQSNNQSINQSINQTNKQ